MHRVVALVSLQVALNNLRNDSTRFRYNWWGRTSGMVLIKGCLWTNPAGVFQLDHPHLCVCVCVCFFYCVYPYSP